MGSVKIDRFKKEREWNNVNLSTPESVQGLLKYRSQFDLLFGRDTTTINIDTTNVDLAKQIEEVTCLYVWIDDILKRMKLTEQQDRIIQRFMEGYTIEDIADEDSTTPQNVNKLFNRICTKISNMALRDWRKVVYIRKLGLKTKRCAKCGEELPATDEFFSQKSDSKDGFHPYCKLCR